MLDTFEMGLKSELNQFKCEKTSFRKSESSLAFAVSVGIFSIIVIGSVFTYQLSCRAKIEV